MVKEKATPYEVQMLSGPLEAALLLRKFLGERDRECMAAIHLDCKNRINSVEIVSIGTLNSSPAHPREVFKGAILANAAAIVLGHNHPSGDPTPSREDIEVTRRMVEAGHILGIQVLDHVIIADDGWVSLKERQLIPIKKAMEA
ncbi:JAB domain-containing protein [Neomoorella glycerini]|nr:JAB domain-containing protein [Moorella glycerini]